MTTPSQDDRIEIWRYTYARSSLIEAREAAKTLISHKEFSDEMKQAFLCQMMVAYARPFMQSQVTHSSRIVPLDARVVPAEFQQLHDEHLQMRNKAIGHKDAVAFPSAIVNKVFVGVDGSGFELRTAAPYEMVDTALQATVRLCDHLIDHCVSKVQAYCPHFNGLKNGIYMLSLDANPAEWLLRQS